MRKNVGVLAQTVPGLVLHVPSPVAFAAALHEGIYATQGRQAAQAAQYAQPGAHPQASSFQIAQFAQRSWQPSSRDLHFGVGGMGDDKPVATSSDKSRLTKQASDLFQQSKTAPSELLRGQIQGALGELAYYQPWTDSSSGIFGWGSYYDSQTVRANLQQALENVMVATKKTTSGEDVSSSWRPQTEEMKPVSTTVEWAKNVPGEVTDRTSSCFSDPRACLPKCADYLPAVVCDHPIASAGMAIAALVLAPRIVKAVKAVLG